MQVYNLMNADLMDSARCTGPLPSECKVGTVVVVLRELKACPWLPNAAATIQPGRYVVQSRKHFRGGSQAITKA